MAEAWKSVVFNEGAPLDPNDLNQLQTNLTNVFNTSKSLLNATKDASGTNRVAIIDSNVETIPLSGKANVASSAFPVTFSSSFNSGTEISFTASVGDVPLSGAGVISVAAVVTPGTLSGKIYVTTSLAKAGSVKVNWIAAQLKDI
jgi:hypothetical protein